MVWTWDILHLYALAGFGLFALRRLSNRTLLSLGIVFGIVAMAVHKALSSYAGLDRWHGLPSPCSDSAVLQRQALSEAGDVPGLIAAFARFTLLDWLLSGFLVAWFFYALGRFLVGAWVGRHGWLQHAKLHLSGFRRVMAIALPAGLLLAGLSVMMEEGLLAPALGASPHWEFAGYLVGLVGTPILAAGYVCAVVVALHTRFGRPLLAPFRHIGRMALTNYVGLSLAYGFVLFGVGPGLALGGRIGSFALLLIVIGAYAAQLLLSRWWLTWFSYGLLEWLWRGLTYRKWPPLLRRRAT